MIALVLIALVMGLALTWRRRGGGLLPLAMATAILSPLAAAGLVSAAWSRRRLTHPAAVRRALVAAGCGRLVEGRTISARRINKGRMNAVLLVTLTGDAEPPRQLILKHQLPFGTLLGGVARWFGATRENPRQQGTAARCAREVRALIRLRGRGFRVPRCLGHDLRRRVIAMEYLPGDDLAPALGRDPRLIDQLGRLLARMHAAAYSMGDAHPENMAVDQAGCIVVYDFENSHFGAEVTTAKRAFDLAWAGAFLASARDRERLLAAYGPCSHELRAAILTARRHIARFSPLVEWYGRRWRTGGRRPAHQRSALFRAPGAGRVLLDGPASR